MGTVATLGGFPVLGREVASWALTDGVRPNRQAFELLAEHAQALLDAQAGFDDPQQPGPGVRFEWTIEGGPTQRIERLYPIAVAPTDLPQTLMVVVVDRRFWWSYIGVARAYNVRRKVGQRYLYQEGAPLDLQQLTDYVKYAPWSLRNFAAGTGEAWTARTALEDVLDVVTGGGYRFDESFKRDVPIEGLQLKGPGDDELQRTLAFVGGVGIALEPDGTVVIRDARDGREAQIVPALTPLVGTELPARVSHRLTRPRKVRVAFQRNLEMRFDSKPELTTTQASQATQQRVQYEDTRTIENVAATCDVVTVLSDGRRVAPGTWVRLDELLTAWGSSKNAVAGQRVPLTADLIRSTYFYPGLIQGMVAGLGTDASEVLAMRIATARYHWRRTWQLGSKVLDRIASLSAERVGALDYVTRKGAQAPAYLDWTEHYSVRGAFEAFGHAPEQFALFKSLTGYAALLQNAKRAPFTVTIKDADQGVFHIDPANDPLGRRSYAPGRACGPAGDADPAPVADARNGLAGGTGTILSSFAGLVSGFQVAVVLTVTAGAPNDEARFHFVEVTPEQAGAKLGLDLGPCDGPVMDVQVDPALIPARQEWNDDQADAIQGAIGIPYGDPTSLVPQNHGDLAEVALACACQVYAGEVDRVEGSVVGAFNPTVRPIGSVGRVVHALAPNGVATTTVDLPSERPGLNFLAYLNEGTRRRILGLVDPRGIHS